MALWNEKQVELLKKLWAEGFSASQIANRMGGVTRNAVLGKLHRLGLSGRAQNTRHSPRPRRPKPKTVKKHTTMPGNTSRAQFTNVKNPALRALYESSAPHAETHEELVIPVRERKSLETLTECSCRWPIGNPKSPDFHFCGKQKVDGLPYCEFHARKAFQPPGITRARQKQAEKALQDA